MSREKKSFPPVYDTAEEEAMRERRITLMRKQRNAEEMQELRWLNKWIDIVGESYNDRVKHNRR